jgi:hypothetical protein
MNTTTDKLLHVTCINDKPCDFYYNTETKTFFTKVPRRIVSFVYEYKPIAWKKINNKHMKMNGDLVCYNHEYLYLGPNESKVRLHTSDLEKLEFTPAMPSVGSPKETGNYNMRICKEN